MVLLKSFIATLTFALESDRAEGRHERMKKDERQCRDTVLREPWPVRQRPP